VKTEILIKRIASIINSCASGCRLHRLHPDAQEIWFRYLMSDNSISIEKIKQIERVMNSILAIIEQGNKEKALELIGEFEKNSSNDKTTIFCAPGFWINIGSALGNASLVKRGVDIGENNLKDPSFKKHLITLQYNVANGYMSLFEILEFKSNDQPIPRSELLQKAKYYYRQVLYSLNGQDPHLEIQVLVNYANCLDTLGRHVEALEAYDDALQIDKNFPMAIANKAKAMKFFADVSGQYRIPIYVEAYQAIKSVIDNPDLIKVGGLHAKISFQKEMEYIESMFVEDKTILSEQLNHPHYALEGLSDFERFYLDFCSKQRLFLNFHIHHTKCEAAIQDPIFIGMVTKISDNDTFYTLAKRLNQIKEDYATARLLLVQAQYRRNDFDSISERTTYVNCLDYSMFNLYMGLLKSSFKEAYNILDKIAVFINDYYKLKIPENSIYFTSIWHKKGQLRDELIQSNNISLFALYDIYKDFKSGENDRIQEIRNALTHRRLVIFDEALVDKEEKAKAYNIEYREMLSLTVYLLQLTKAAVIYLINFVNVEENKKRAGKEFIPSIPVDTFQHFHLPPP